MIILYCLLIFMASSTIMDDINVYKELIQQFITIYSQKRITSKTVIKTELDHISVVNKKMEEINKNIETLIANLNDYDEEYKINQEINDLSVSLKEEQLKYIRLLIIGNVD